MNQRRNEPSDQSDNMGARRVAFVQACWHKEIVDRCRVSFAEEIAKRGFAEDDIDFYEVPGSFEIPLHASLLAKSGRYAAIVAAGFVVDGGIYRNEFVAEAVIGGLMRVQLETGVPVISAVLTPQHFHEHEEHRSRHITRTARASCCGASARWSATRCRSSRASISTPT
jgi:6,7-dimethyl-8-ribityllumazine synthase